MISTVLIKSVIARQILDSRGYPTVEADVQLDSGAMGRAAVPSGASTGSGEALELRDGGNDWGGRGVTQALANIHDELAPALKGVHADDQTKIDDLLRQLDGSPNKAKMGANAILAVSLAIAKAAANELKLPFYKYVGGLADNDRFTMPTPMFNLLNGGRHAAGSTDIQEFMVIPKSSESFATKLQIGAEIFYALKSELESKKFPTTVGDEGGFAPPFTRGSTEALQMLIAAISRTKYTVGVDVMLGLDVAASEFKTNDGYELKAEQRKLSTAEMIDWYHQLAVEFPISSIEDGLGEDDWDGWVQLTERLGRGVQLVGDDLLVTNTELLKKAIDRKAGNAILIKPNQIGTLTETIDAVKAAKAAGWRTIISHRSGETEDTTIAHLAVGLNAGQIKAGSLSRSERLAKYNELLRIEEDLA